MGSGLDVATRARLLVVEQAANPSADVAAMEEYIAAVVVDDEDIDQLARRVARTSHTELIKRFLELVPNASENLPKQILLCLQIMENGR